MSHHCHAAGCKVSTPPKMFMCRRHWYMVPESTRARISRAYRPGQCDDWKITSAYVDAAKAGVKAVAEKEGKSEDEIEKACRVYNMLDQRRHN
jgi:hypothetical protein